MTIRDLIKGSLRLVGVTASGEEPSASEMQDSLQALNMMIGSWSTERLALFRLSREVFELVPGKGIYTVGAGGDFESSRPMEIVRSAYGDLIKTPIYQTPEPTPEEPDPVPVIVGYNLAVNHESPMSVCNYQQWAGISMKSLQSSAPGAIYAEGTSPLETLHVYPVPSQAMGLVVYAKKALDAFADANTEIQLPPGYEQALKYNLAVLLGSEFGKEVSARIEKTAIDSKAAIKRQNIRVPLMKSDAYGISTRAGK